MIRQQPRIPHAWLVGLVVVAALAVAALQAREPSPRVSPTSAPLQLPSTAPPPSPAPGPALSLPRGIDVSEQTEVLKIVAAIDAGGPFVYRVDGSVFENRERRLPRQPKGYYREYTVDDPDDDRGVRRIVGGENGELYYSRDHYKTFTRLRAPH